MAARKGVDTERLKKAFQQAAEVAALVPEPMQEAAFNRALDQYLGIETTSPSKPASSTGSGRTAGARGRAQDVVEPGSEQTEEDGPVERLVMEIDRTKYPEIFNASRVADRALRVLRLAEEDFGIEWLSAPDIARILSDKFRLKTSHQAVRNGLTPLGKLFDTREQKGGSRGKITVYRLMRPGIDYLDSPGSGVSSDAPTSAARKSAGAKRKKASPSPSKRRSVSTTANKSPESPTPKRKGRGGPKQSLGALIDDGFFDAPKTIREAQEQLKHKKGVTFTVQELSPALVRLLRDGRLDRDQNESGHYEYKRG